MTKEKTMSWNTTQTGYLFHNFENGQATCNRRIKGTGVGTSFETLEATQEHAKAWRVGSLRNNITVCEKCEAKELAFRERAEASMAPSTGEGDHLPPARTGISELTPKMVEEMEYAVERGGATGFLVYCPKSTLNALVSRGLVTLEPRLSAVGEANRERWGYTHPALTVAGWQTITGGVRPADQERMTLEEALAEAYTEKIIVPAVPTRAQMAQVPSPRMIGAESARLLRGKGFALRASAVHQGGTQVSFMATDAEFAQLVRVLRTAAMEGPRTKADQEKAAAAQERYEALAAKMRARKANR
jgi:hypothetical protein